MAVNLTAVGLTVVALAFALLQQLMVRRQTADLLILRQALSTRYIGHFPDYLPQLVDLIESARQEILIVCDIPSYGIFTDRVTWLRYRHAIEDKLQAQVSITMRFLSPSRRRRLISQQFSSLATSKEEWQRSVWNSARLVEFLRLEFPGIKNTDVTPQVFTDLLEQHSARAAGIFFAAADIDILDTDLPLYFWVVDRSRAVFAIPTFAKSEFGYTYGFFTSDSRLVSALVTLGRRYQLWSLDRSAADVAEP